jgi:hypothetical protein
MDKINNTIKTVLDPILLDNPYVKTFIILLLAAYPALARPKLPNSIEKLFEKPLVRFVLITYIIYDLETSKDIYLAVIISLLFLVMMHQINKNRLNKELEKINRIKQNKNL